MRREELDVRKIPISFIDLEMTGLEGSKHEIVEIGLVKASQPELQILETWEIKVRPDRLQDADQVSLKISGYEPDKWKEAVSLKRALEMLSPKVENTIFAGWNVAVDYSFLDSAMTKTGIPLDFHKRILDVASFAGGKLGLDKGFQGIMFVSKSLGIEVSQHHSALPDAMACFEIYKKLVSREPFVQVVRT